MSADGLAQRRPLRSFVLREGRMTDAQRRAIDELWPRFGADGGEGRPLDLGASFAEDRPVFLEIGFGNGEALLELAARHPQHNYLGVEVHRPGIGHLLLQLARHDLSNVRLVRRDAVEVLRDALAPASLAGAYLLFPDPWPKQRHRKRRLLQPDFVHLLARVLRPGGIFHAATDWEDYAMHMLEVMSAADGLFVNGAGEGRFSPRPPDRPLTRFERRGRRRGHGVWDLVFRRL